MGAARKLATISDLEAAGRRGGADRRGARREGDGHLPAKFGVTVPPDRVCELLSDRTARRDLGEKRAMFHRHRVGHYWVVDPERQVLMISRWGPDGYVTVETAGPGEKIRAEPFELVEIDTDELFGIERED